MTLSERSLSVVLPVHQQADHIATVLEELRASVDGLAATVEFVIVVNGSSDASADVCRAVGAMHVGWRVIERPTAGWGAAVRAGLNEATGDVLAFTNSARTTGTDLRTAVALAMLNDGHAVKAVRQTRDHVLRRLGSVLYNFEGKALFGLASWDINGTPKVFPREFAGLLQLAEGGDLLDLEWLVTCDRRGYPLIEFPVTSVARRGGRSTTSLTSAVRMYRGAIGLRGRLGPGRRLDDTR